jgi:hypothetical protein
MWETRLHWMKDGDNQQAVVLVGDEATCRPRYEKRRTENMPQRADEHDHENEVVGYQAQSESSKTRLSYS